MDAESLRILLIGDTDAQHCPVANCLRLAGFEVIEASNGPQAIEISRQQPDLVLLDLKLSDVDSFQVCRRIRSDPRTADIPVIQISAYSTDADLRSQGLQDGADDYVRNSASTEELVLKMNLWARVRRAEGDLRRKSAELQRMKEELGRELKSKSDEITERKRTEIASERLAQQHKLALDAAKLGWWHYDPVTEIIAWDNRFKQIFQLEANAHTKIDLNTRIHPDDLHSLWAAVESALDPGKPVPYSVEYRIVLPDGSTRWIESYGMASFTGMGKHRHAADLVGTVADITDRKLANEAVRNSEERYHSLFENMVEGFFLAEVICDEAGEPIDFRYLAANPALETLTGLKREELVGKTAQEVLPGLEEVWIKVFGRVALTGEPARICDFAAPLQRYYETAAYSPRPGQFACIFADITERKQADETVHASEQRLRALVTASSDVIYRMSPDWSEMRDIHGRGFIAATNEPSRSWVETYLPPDERERVLQVVHDAIRVRSIFEMEHRVLRADGGIGWTFSRAIPVLDSRGEIIEWFGVATDITERKRAEEALRQSEQRLVIAKHAAGIGIHDFNVETRTVTWDRRIREIWGLEPDEPVTYGKFMSGIHPEDRARIEKDIEGALNPDGNHRFFHEYRVLNRKTDQEHWVSASGQVSFEQRRPVRLVGTAQDITERKQAEQALRDSEQRFRTLADNMSQFSWMTDADGSAVWYNRRWYEYTGTTLEEMQGWGWTKVHHPDHVQRVVDKISHCFATGELWEDTFPLLGRDGNYRWFLSRAVPIRDEEGKIVRWFGTNTDIHEQKCTQELLVRSEKVAALGRMAASLAHDINNPLAAVVNALYLARNSKDLPETVKGYLDLADEELMRIAHVTRQALGFYREETKPVPVAVSRIVEEAIDLFRGKLKAKDIKVEKNYECDWQVTAISGELRQVFSNLVANSIDAVTQHGSIRVRVARSKDPKTCAPCVRISVADDGKGIEPTDRPRVFEPLFTTKGPVGTGLGLWMSKQLIEKHGGSIRVRSNSHCKRRGTTFSILLPAQTADAGGGSMRKMSA